MKLRNFLGLSFHALSILGLSACGGGDDPVKEAPAPLTYSIGGSVSGLASGTSFVVGDNAGHAMTIDANGTYAFSGSVPLNGNYTVAITTQPIGQTCSVAHFSGSGVTGDVAFVDVTCSADTYTVAGAITGLAIGQTVALIDNGIDALVVNADGTFSFATPVPYNGSYAVTVGTQPVGQTCTVSKSSGAGVTANVADVSITCSANTYTVSGTVSGLGAGVQVTLNNNSADAKTLSADGSFSFATPVAFNGGYAVTVGTQPVGQTCTVSNGSANGVVANVATVSVTCSVNTFTISGTVAGLQAGHQVTLNNNGADATVVHADGSFSFKTPVAFNAAYAVTVATSPTGQNCDLKNDSGAAVVSDVSNVSVTCWVRPLYAYLIGREGSSVLQFTIGIDGTLKAMNTPSISTDPFFSTDAIGLDVSGQYVNVEAFEVDNDGIFIENLRYPIGANGELIDAPYITDPVTYAPIGSTFSDRFAYSAGDGVVTQSAVALDGTLTPLNPPSVVTGEGQFLVVDPTEHYLYVGSGSDDTVWQYNIRPDGTLQPMNPPTVSVPGLYPIKMVIVPGPTLGG